MQLKGMIKGIKETLSFQGESLFSIKKDPFILRVISRCRSAARKKVGEMSSPAREPSNPNIFKRFYCIMKTWCTFL